MSKSHTKQKSKTMATAVASQVSDKILCSGGCGNSYTKATLDKNGGACGRCAKKTNPTAEPALQLPTINTVKLPQVFPTTSIADHLTVPMANMSLTADNKSLPVQTVTYSTRLENWAESRRKANPNNIKVLAAIAAVVVDRGTASDHKRMDAIPNLSSLALEKKWDLDLNAYI